MLNAGASQLAPERSRMYPASTSPTIESIPENQTDQFGSGSRGKSAGRRVRQKRVCCQAASATAAEPNTTSPTPMYVEPGLLVGFGFCRRSLQEQPEPRNDKAQADHRNPSPHPRQERALGGKEHTGIVRIVHVAKSLVHELPTIIPAANTITRKYTDSSGVPMYQSRTRGDHQQPPVRRAGD